MERIWTLGYPEMRWAKVYDTVLLLDPSTGRPAGEMHAGSAVLHRYSGTLRFAGDPRIAGVIGTGEGRNRLSLTSSSFVDRTVALAEAVVMRPGHTPPRDFLRYGERLLDDRHPWVADQPNRPS